MFLKANRLMNEALTDTLPSCTPNIFFSLFRAYMLLPGIYFHPIFGKLLFAIADIAIGELLRKILSLKDKNKDNDLLVAAWYFNPISINVSTRGIS